MNLEETITAYEKEFIQNGSPEVNEYQIAVAVKLAEYQRFDELKAIINKVSKKQLLKVCLILHEKVKDLELKLGENKDV